MTLIKSISGIRGTIGGHAGEGLNPLDIVKFTSAYATLIRKTTKVTTNKIVVGRDARISGEMVKNVVCGTLMGMGFDVVNIGLATTPTTELAVTMEKACGGIILTASHNPRQWNALKLLNEKGEFLNKEEGNEVLRIAEAEAFEFADVDHMGHYREDYSYDQKHIDAVLNLKLVDAEAVRKAGFKVALDTVNSVGGIILPKLLKQLGVEQVTTLYGEPTGDFQHNPEPLEKNLGDIMQLMAKGGHYVAFVVDPDVDRLAII
ncbi:MAG: phosphoglucosamine mutase, partial [Phocaeicola sp.]|nr:phosphoglucosamine mutase [Phocaeicola sp.]